MLKRNDSACFDLLTYFEGRTLASGVFEGRDGTPRRRFEVELTGTVQGSLLLLEEHFLFDDGERQQRTWRLLRGSGQDFTGHCDDSIGEARGSFECGRATLDSTLRLKVRNRSIPMTFKDVFYDTGAGTVLNRSTVSKWGIRLGQVLILFRKS